MTAMPDFLGRIPTPTADAAVATLQVLGLAPERVELVPVGPLESYRGEVVGQMPAPGQRLAPDTEVVLFVSREGLAQRLPHDVLEPLPTAQDAAHLAIEPGQALDYWERQVAAYGSGRQLVTVIDRALARLDRDLARLFSAVGALSRDPTFAERCLEFVGLLDLPLTPEEEIFLSGELQRLEQWVGPAAGVATLLTQFLGLPVEVKETAGSRLSLPSDLRAPLGSEGARLSRLCLGPRFRDPMPRACVRIGPVPLAQHVALDADPAWHRKVEALLAMASPAAVERSFELLLRPEDRGAVLGDRLRSRLGRTSYLAA